MQALHVSPVDQALSNLLPVFASISQDCFGKNFIFLLSPMTFDLDVGTSGSLLLLVLGRSSLVKLGVRLLVFSDD